MILSLESKLWLGANFFDHGEVLFATGRYAIDYYVFNLPDDLIQVFLGCIGNFAGCLYLLGHYLTGSN